MQRARVIIDPGHGGTQAYGGSSPGLEEKHVNLELARRVATRLGALAQMTRSSDVNVPLRERAQMAARTGARVLVSIHSNSGAKGLRGSEVWLHEHHDAGSAALARAIHGSLDRVGPTRGLYRGPLAVLEPTAVGGAAACLIEADYLSDPQGRRRLTSARGLDELADAIAAGVRDYLGRSEGAQAPYGRRRDYDAYESDAYYPYAPDGGSSGTTRALTADQTWYLLEERRFEIHGAGQSAASFSVHVPPVANPSTRVVVVLSGDLRVHTANPLTLRAELSDPFASRAIEHAEQTRMLEGGFRGEFNFEWTNIQADRMYMVSLSTPDLSARLTGTLRVHSVM